MFAGHGASLLHAEFAERAGKAAGGRPKQMETAVDAVTSAFRSMICQGMLTGLPCRIQPSAARKKVELEYLKEKMMDHKNAENNGS
jgi:hypothetical protein